MAVDGVTSTSGTSSSASSGQSASSMSSTDFYKLLIAELQNQDPFQPMDNSKMVEQVASISSIQSSANMTQALQSVTRQQNFGTASTMIGKQVVGSLTDSAGQAHDVTGVVSRVLFEANGNVTLELEDGTKLPLESVTSVQDRPQASSTGGQKIVQKQLAPAVVGK